MPTPIDTLKGWFETGDKPTQAQFAALIDAFRYGGDKITFADLDEDLQDTITAASASKTNIVLAAGTSSYVIPAGTTIVGIVFIDATNPAGIKVGTSAGGEQIYPSYDSANGYCLQSGLYYFKANTTIYFTNITGATISKIYKL